MASIGDTLEHYGKQIVESLKAKIAEKKLVASGGLLQSLKYSVKIFGKDYVMHVGFSPEYEIVASTMNDGGKWTKGKMPNVNAIDQWLFKKGILPKAVRGNKPLKDKLKARKGLAFAIAKSIQKKGVIKRFGYKGSRFWDEVINDELKTELMTDLKKALKRDVIIEFGTLKKEIKSHGG